MIDELDILNPQVIVTAPIRESDLIDIAYQVGRRSIVDELIRLRDKGQRND